MRSIIKTTVGSCMLACGVGVILLSIQNGVLNFQGNQLSIALSVILSMLITATLLLLMPNTINATMFGFFTTWFIYFLFETGNSGNIQAFANPMIICFVGLFAIIDAIRNP